MQGITHIVRAGLLVIFSVLAPATAMAVPFADFVMDARTGREIHSQNADTKLHPASLTKMMTLYMAFTAIERGQVRLDSKFLVSTNAASEPPSKLGLRAGQRIELRYLIRAAAVKSANDAATVIGEGLAGSEERFTQQMTAMARALGMRNTQFRNANGLTTSGHYSTARDMTILGRRLFYDFPQYYSIFSRRTADAGVAKVSSTNRRFLDSYEGADGIKTGYTRAAGFNLTASAQRGSKRIIATVMGGKSTAQRNAIMAELLDAGFSRAPKRVREIRPEPQQYMAKQKVVRKVQVARQQPQPVQKIILAKSVAPVAAPAQRGSTMPLAIANAVAQAANSDMTLRNSARPVSKPGRTLAMAEVARPPQLEEGDRADDGATALLARSSRPSPAPRQPEPTKTAKAAPNGSLFPPQPQASAEALTLAASPAPKRRAETVILAAMEHGDAPAATEIVSRASSSGGRHNGVSLGYYNTRYQAEQLLLKTALQESTTLESALRNVGNTKRGWEATFVGLSRGEAQLACERLRARQQNCSIIGP